jgi:hypothetical protein
MWILGEHGQVRFVFLDELFVDEIFTVVAPFASHVHELAGQI